MSLTIFVEGGGNSELTLRSYRQGFSTYCGKLSPIGKKPKIVACGSRNQAFDKFKTAVRVSEEGDRCALLVDSEAPVTTGNAVQHLSQRDGWVFPPNIDSHRAFLMVQMTESWFLADREAIAEFYDGGFLPNALSQNQNIEAIPKADVESGLKKATRETRKKGEYRKVMHGSELVGLIDPLKVEAASPHAKRFNDFLRSL